MGRFQTLLAELPIWDGPLLNDTKLLLQFILPSGNNDIDNEVQYVLGRSEDNANIYFVDYDIGEPEAWGEDDFEDSLRHGLRKNKAFTPMLWGEVVAIHEACNPPPAQRFLR